MSQVRYVVSCQFYDSITTGWNSAPYPSYEQAYAEMKNIVGSGRGGNCRVIPIPIPQDYVPEPIEEPPYIPPEERKACIIATVFLGEQHPLLPPMRKFRDLFIPKLVMDTYYSVSVYVLRKIGRI